MTDREILFINNMLRHPLNQDKTLLNDLAEAINPVINKSLQSDEYALLKLMAICAHNNKKHAKDIFYLSDEEVNNLFDYLKHTKIYDSLYNWYWNVYKNKIAE